jgi:hypothetical protein
MEMEKNVLQNKNVFPKFRGLRPHWKKIKKFLCQKTALKSENVRA